jgi:translation initiation factor IF-2
MTKMRVYEYAKKNNLTSKDVIEKLKQLNIEVSNHMTTIEENVIRQLDQSFGYTKPVTEKPMKIKIQMISVKNQIIK